MALFHGSGYFFVSDAIVTSNAAGFLKDIVPALFAHPSIHLLGLAAFGFMALTLTIDAKKVLTLISILVVIDALFAFYLGSLLAGCLLLIPSISFIIARKNA